MHYPNPVFTPAGTSITNSCETLHQGFVASGAKIQAYYLTGSWNNWGSGVAMEEEAKVVLMSCENVSWKYSSSESQEHPEVHSNISNPCGTCVVSTCGRRGCHS